VVPSTPSTTPVYCIRPFRISHNSFSILSTKDDSKSDSDSDAEFVAHTISFESIAQQFITIQKKIWTEFLPGICIQVTSNSHFNA